MQIALTHEQADFDAIASLLGANILFDEAIPLLPHRLNRNVRAYLNLYGADLPFKEIGDLPNETVQHVILVDTQSITSVKGMTAATSVQVIDHHPRREGLPEVWIVTTEETGATTTLLVEALREQNGDLNTIQSTLLLLGIYEDTGSLTYSHTTSRDLRAAAYLLEQGASLQIANNFINHPLSPRQQDLYDQLRSTAEIFRIHGYSVVVACSDAVDMEEELSTVVHKLRDLLDPDALLVLVTTKGGVQLIARSTTDNIDVAAIAAHFGGGGHERAAAGLIRNRDLERVRQELIEILPKFVRPSIAVSQILSRDPHLVAPQVQVEQVAEMMRRYGYEGFPVVNEGKILGLVTRRAVDRAITHKLDATASSLMDAGEYSVSPDDSIEHLQRLMTDTGWGQIPVVSPESGEIIGIVTRTDLLKTLSPQPKLPSRQKLVVKLENALPPYRHHVIKTIARIAYQQHSALYIVGGFVRDLLLEKPGLDFDLVVEGDAIALAQVLAREYGGRITSHPRFGTAKWHLEGAYLGDDSPPQDNSEDHPTINSIDLVTARTEFYSQPSALPIVERSSIKLDLHRRDFTINTLALRLDGNHYGELHDYWGGLNDLKQGIVRVLHSLSFIDDPTRILRAVRFEQRFKFCIEDRTMELLEAALPLLDRLSGDRIRHELDNILIEENVERIIGRLNELSLLSTIHPALVWDDWLVEKFRGLRVIRPPTEWGLGSENESMIPIKRKLAYIIWFIRLPVDQARQVLNRLRIFASLKNTILLACQLWLEQDKLAHTPPSQAVLILDAMPPLCRYALYMCTSEQRVRDALLNYVIDWAKVKPTLDGNDLRKRGIPPGPIYRDILSRLRNAWLDGEIGTAEQELELLDAILLDKGKCKSV